ncbi:response regulator [Cohnella sp. GCM10020058]|uniref:response regulator transcription factor n=1 Tax=Cohnella sp. GCM10020058 TaxID=3317330 RepID=UPI0036282E5C
MQDILVVDDEPLIRLGLKKIIDNARAEFQVRGEAGNGNEGLEKLAAHRFHTVITDIKMPGMNGVEFVKSIFSRHPGVRVIVLSGYAEFEFVRETMKYGAVDYLLKPVDNQDLLDLLTEIGRKPGAAGSVPDAPPASPAPKNDPISRAKAYIAEHYRHNISLNEIAGIVHLNAIYFSQLFKKETGENFTGYLIRCRIEQAQRLLEDPHNRIAEISLEVGYEDPNYFSRIFKRMTGLSPQEYRAQRGGRNA